MRYTGILFVVLGTVLLLKNLGFITIAVWDVIWPIAIVFFGLSFMMRGRHHFGGICGGWCKGKMCGKDCEHCEEETENKK